MSAAEEWDEGHLIPEIIVAYIEGSIGPAERETVERHAAECAQCRQELIDIARIVRRRPAWRRWFVVAPVAAAAVLLLFIIGTQIPERRPGESTLRGSANGLPEAVPRITVVSPVGLQDASADSITFTWRQAAADASYRLTITNTVGDVVWEVTTTDTTVALAADVRLDVGRTYYWYVDGLLLDGRSVTTGVQALALSGDGK